MVIELERFVRRQKLILPGDTVICAVSGGADSMALLWCMYLLRDKLQITLEAAHFNHGLRGEESDGDEAFVKEFCNGYQIPLHCGRGCVKAGKKGLEAAARDARYDFFHTLNGKVATAHTADDNAETVLMHLVRGTGLKGLGGISPSRGNVIRPMLEITRQQVESFLAEYHIPHRDDSSNSGDAFLRNRLRHHVLPLLKQENPRLAENLSEMALRLRQDEQTLQDLSQIQWPPCVSELRKMPAPLRTRALERFLKENGVREPEAQHIGLAEALVFSDKPSARANFPGRVQISRCYDRLVCSRPETVPKKTVLPYPGGTFFGNYHIQCIFADRIIQSDQAFTVSPVGVLTVRSRQTGDKITVSGGTATVKKLMIDRKIPAAMRPMLPVFEDELGILAVGGIGVNQRRIAENLPCWQIIITDLRNKE